MMKKLTLYMSNRKRYGIVPTYDAALCNRLMGNNPVAVKELGIKSL